MPVHDRTLWEMIKPKSEIILSLEERISIICKSLDGLIYLQKKKLLHLDIKPSNIMLDLSGNGNWNRETVILTDFGLCTKFEVLSGEAGTPGYGSPEQFLGRPTEQSDNFAVGKLGIITMFPWEDAWHLLRQPLKDGEGNPVTSIPELKIFHEAISSLLDVS